MPTLNELLLFPQSPKRQAVFLSYEHGQIIAANNEACLLYGYTENEILQYTSNQLTQMCPELLAFRERLQHHEVVYAQLPAVTKKGDVFSVLVETRLVQKAPARPLYIVKIVPLSELNPAPDSESLTTIGNWELDFATQTIQLDASLRQMNGSTMPPQLSLKTAEKYLGDKALRKRIGALAREAALYGTSWTESFPMNLPGNSQVWVQCCCKPVFRSGSCIGLKGTIQDITVFKQLDCEYAEQNVQLNFLLENINHAVTIRDGNMNLLYCNELVLRLFGYDKEQFSRLKIGDLVYWEDQEKTVAALKQVRTKGSINNFENRVITKSGEVKTLSWSFIWFSASEKLYAVGKDITDLKQAKRIYEGYVLETGEEEKHELFTELHENICQTFAAAKIYISAYMNEGNKDNLQKANEMVSTGLETARALAAVHLFPDLKLQSFVEALRIYVMELNKAGRTHFTLDTRSFRGRDLPYGVKIMMYRILQTLTTGIIQYSGAEKASLKMLLKSSNLSIELRYKPAPDKNDCFSNNQKTIDRLQSRIDQLGGSIELVTEAGAECRILLELDLLKYDGFSFLGKQSVADE